MLPRSSLPRPFEPGGDITAPRLPSLFTFHADLIFAPDRELIAFWCLIESDSVCAPFSLGFREIVGRFFDGKLNFKGSPIADEDDSDLR
jgi:hypothetical protein